MTVIPEAAEVTIGKNGNKHKLKDCWITNETKALVEKRDKQGRPGTLEIHKDGKFKDVNFKKAVTAGTYGKNKLSGLKLRMMPWPEAFIISNY